MRIAETFYSIQGEGMLAGVPSTFIRTSGCPLSCRWCDTPYALRAQDGEGMTVPQIVEAIGAWPTRHVVITGGEPMIQPEVVELTEVLAGRGLHITIETAGTVFRAVRCDLMSVSPKLSNSTPVDDARRAAEHEAHRLDVECLGRLISAYDYQLKFVVQSAEDLVEVDRVWTQLGRPDPTRVLLMPEGTDRRTLRARARWLVALCKERGFRYGPRLHVELYGRRRGV